MARLRPEQWADIRAAWIGTDKPIRELAREYGVDHKAITKRAENELWGNRNSNMRKAEAVAAKLAGAHRVPNRVPNTVPTGEEIEADKDVEVMTNAASVGRSIIERCRELLESSPDPTDLNKLSDAWRKAVDGYRKIRGLDIPPPPGAPAERPFAHMTDEEIERALDASSAK